AFLSAHQPACVAGRRAGDQCEEGRRDGAGPVGPAASPRILSATTTSRSYSLGATAPSGTLREASFSRKLAGVRAGRPSSVANAPVTAAVTSSRWLSASRISCTQLDP